MITMSAKAIKTLKKIMFAWIVVLILLQIMGYTTSQIKDLNSNRANDKAVQKLSQSVSQAIETKDMGSIFEVLSVLKSAPHSNFARNYRDMTDSIFNTLNDFPEFLPVIEKLVANGDYLERSFPILQDHFTKVKKPLLIFIAYEDDNSNNHEIMQMMASTKDTNLYREIYSRTRMKIIEQFNANDPAPNIMLAKMQSLNLGIHRQFPDNPDILGWSGDRLTAIAKLVSAIDYYHKSESLQKRLSEINKELEGESDHFWLSGYIEKVWRTDDKSNSETYLATVGGSSQCLLMMLGDRFTSTGSFSKKVFKYGSETVKTEGGFTKEIPVFVVLAESSLPEIEGFKKEKSSILNRLRKIERSLGFSPTKENIINKHNPSETTDEKNISGQSNQMGTDVHVGGDLAYDAIVKMETNMGTILIDIYEDRAPKHSANFKKLATEGAFNDTYFHRVIPNFIVQGGDPLTRDNTNRQDDGTGGIGENIPPEIGQPHLRGTLAAARDNNPEKKSNGSQFYFCLADLPKLDGEYTVFGKVVQGMDVVDEMGSVKTDRRDNPREAINILNTEVIRK